MFEGMYLVFWRPFCRCVNAQNFNDKYRITMSSSGYNVGAGVRITVKCAVCGMTYTQAVPDPEIIFMGFEEPQPPGEMKEYFAEKLGLLLGNSSG